MPTNHELITFHYLCAKALYSRQAPRHATRLWNWADCTLNPELFWDILRMYFPSLFYGPTANEFRFTY